MTSRQAPFTLLLFYLFTFFTLLPLISPQKTISTKKLKIAKNNLYFSTN